MRQTLLSNTMLHQSTCMITKKPDKAKKTCQVFYHHNFTCAM